MARPTQVDPRGMRVAAAITALVLALVLVTPPPVSIALLVAQGAVFGIGALVSLKASPYSIVFARFVRPRIGPPAELEDARPPRFAQVVGLVFAVLGLIGFALGSPAVGFVAVALALVAALLNATVGLCLGCEMYLAWNRLRPAKLTTPA
jgi:membrane associated rhomboid family serine protease